MYATVLAEADERMVFEARERLIASCMAARGFEYVPHTFVPLVRELLLGQRRWGPLEWSDQGYRGNAAISAMESAAADAEHERHVLREAMSKATLSGFYLALLGYDPEAINVPLEPTFVEVGSQRIEVSTTALDGSCQVEVDRALYGSDGRRDREVAVSRYLSVLQDSVDRRAIADEDFVAATQEWSDCFEAEGFEAADPLEAVERYSGRGPEPDEPEVRALRADVECKTAVRFWERWVGALDRAWAARSSDDQALLQELLELRSGLVERARGS